MKIKVSDYTAMILQLAKEEEEQGGCMADWGPGEEEAWDRLTEEEKLAQGRKNLRELLHKRSKISQATPVPLGNARINF